MPASPRRLRGEDLGDPPRNGILTQERDAVEHVRPGVARAQVGGDEAERGAAGGAVQSADLAQDPRDRRVARGHLKDDVDVFRGGGFQRRQLTFAPGGRSRSNVNTPSTVSAEPASNIP